MSFPSTFFLVPPVPLWDILEQVEHMEQNGTLKAGQP